MLHISIPQPCHEDWNVMTPEEHGRHCAVCCKTVIDFTNMTDEEVQHFFLQRKHQQVCGRFRNTQLQPVTIELPGSIFYIAMPLWKKFLVASMLVFSTALFSCNTVIKDKSQKQSTEQSSIQLKTMGKPLVAIDTTKFVLDVPKCTTGVIMVPFPVDSTIIIKGDAVVAKEKMDNTADSTAVNDTIPQTLIKPDSLPPALVKDTADCGIKVFY
ncbi:MAG: hypothetical protein JST86_20480 [Bacteroidetes bacterium]|nr:hypothetical protein [Bacteroidota bacterium]